MLSPSRAPTVAASDVLARMLDDERRVVLDPRARRRAHGSGSRSPRPTTIGRPRRLVERADALDDRAPQEDRERDRALPEVLARQDRRPSLVHDGSRPVTPSRPARVERAATRSSRSVRIDAVVVRKRDDVRRRAVGARCCAHATGPCRSEAPVAALRARRAAARGGRRRSGRRARTRKSRCVWRSSESSRRSSSSTRPTVATTRSKVTAVR